MQQALSIFWRGIPVFRRYSGISASRVTPCKGSYVLNQFPSNVMFGMNGFHVSASGAIQGHHGPLVSFLAHLSTKCSW